VPVAVGAGRRTAAGGDVLKALLGRVLRGRPASSPSRPHHADRTAEADAQFDAGLAHETAGRLAQAEACFRAVLEIAPGHARAAFALAVRLEARGDVAGAVSLLERSVALAPVDALLYRRLGNLHATSGDLERALDQFHRAATLDPDQAETHVSLGNVHALLGHPQEACAAYRRAIELAPQVPAPWHNFAAALLDAGDAAAAIEAYERVLALDPHAVESRFSRALALLGSGDLARGWEAYGIRFEVPRLRVHLRPHPQPGWRGEPLAGRTLLVWGEQGVGDEILFASMYGELAALDGRVVVECRQKLLPLFARAFPRLQFIPLRDPPDPRCRDGIDVQIAAGSLGALLRPTLASFPAAAACLRADPARVEVWRARLAALGPGPKVGFCWRSTKMKGTRALKWTRLDEWGPLFAVAGVHWISLQYDDCAAELGEARARFGVDLHRFDEVDFFDDLDEVGALMQALDLVVSVPTAVSMQAAAHGVETWQLNHGPDWRTLGTSGLPWLPSVRRHVRNAAQGWPDVLAHMAAQLRERFGLRDAVHPGLAHAAESATAPIARTSPEAAGATPSSPPRYFDAGRVQELIERAAAALAAGRHEDAADAYAAALAIVPGHVALRINRAAALASAGRSAEAADELTTATAAPDADASALHAAAAIHERLGEQTRAEACLQRALALDPAHGKSLARLGALCLARGDAEPAAGLLARAAAARPDAWEVHANLGRACLLCRRPQEACNAFARAVQLAPGEADAHAGLGDALQARNELNDAEAAYRRAIEITPTDASLHHRLGVNCLLREQLDAAVAAQGKALSLDPALHGARIALNRALHERGDLDAARTGYEAMIAADPDDGWAHWNLAHALLCEGDLGRGWAAYEWRFHPDVAVATRRRLTVPVWQGEPLAGRTLVVCREQGVGDQIVFASMVPDLTAMAGRVVVECAPKLVPLFAGSFEADVVAKTDPPHPLVAAGADYHVMMGSLPRHLRPSLDAFPDRRAFLRADPARVAHWRERLAALGPGLRVGFCWRSSNLDGERALSCTQLAQWAPLFAVRGVHWVCLQYDECAAELEEAAARSGVALHRHPEVDHFDDLAESAALMSALDLVVSAPTTVSVQSAAIGVPTWQMSLGADWQTLGTDRNPWFPAMERWQRRWGEPWEDVMARIAARLTARVRDGSGG